jgi:hypothetical protein
MTDTKILCSVLSHLDCNVDNCTKVGVLAWQNIEFISDNEVLQAHDRALTAIAFFHFFELLQEAGNSSYFICDDWDSIVSYSEFDFNDAALFYLLGKHGKHKDEKYLDFDNNHQIREDNVQQLVYDHYLKKITSVYAAMDNPAEILENVFAYEEDNDEYDVEDPESNPIVIKHSYDELSYWEFLQTHNIV